MKRWIAAAAVIVSASAFAGESLPGQMPAFGKSVTLDPEGPQFDVPDLRGKAALFIFMQSW